MDPLLWPRLLSSALALIGARGQYKRYSLSRPQDGHEWEVGRWPGLRLTLLAQPEWGPHRLPLAICPPPRNGNEVPFILLIALRQGIDRSYSNTDVPVSVFTLAAAEIRRDVRSCAHRIFDLAVRLQLRQLEARYVSFSRQAVPILQHEIHDGNLIPLRRSDVGCLHSAG